MSQVQTLKKSGRTVLLLSWTHKSFPRKLGVKEMHLEPLCLKQRNTLAWPAPRRPPRHPRDTPGRGFDVTQEHEPSVKPNRPSGNQLGDCLITHPVPPAPKQRPV